LRQLLEDVVPLATTVAAASTPHAIVHNRRRLDAR
jgi:hypothetical protein